MKKTSKTLNFVKSTFLYYCKGPTRYEEFGDSDNVLVMELVQAPKQGEYYDLDTAELREKRRWNTMILSASEVR